MDERNLLDADELAGRVEEDKGKDNGTEGSDTQTSSLPSDKYHIAYILFFLQGLGMLLPWNFFITANDYFQYKFSNVQSIKEKFEEAFSISSMIPGFLALILNIYLTGKTSRNSRILPALVGMCLLFVETAIFVKIDTFSWTTGFFSLTVVSAVIVNTATGVFQGAMFGVAGMVGPKYTQSLMMGQGVAGIFAAIASLITKASGSDVTSSALAYFLIAVAVILVCCVTYPIMFRLPIVAFSIRQADSEIPRGSSSVDDDEPELNIQSPSVSVTGFSIYWLVTKQLFPLAMSVLFIFLVTLALFPSIVSNIHSVHESSNSRWTTTFFSPLVCFLIFNAGDLAGRTAAGSYQMFTEKGYALPLMSFLRIVFVPLFMFCNYQPRRHGSLLFNNDYVVVILNFFFSLSNGYLGSLCMMFGPKLVAPEHAELAGTIMVFFLTAGLLIGSGFSFALAALL